MKQDNGMSQRSLLFKRAFLFILAAYILIGSVIEFEGIAWGTGVWLGQLAFTWAFALFLFGLFCILCLVIIWMILSSPQRVAGLLGFLSSLRDRLGFLHWV